MKTSTCWTEPAKKIGKRVAYTIYMVYAIGIIASSLVLGGAAQSGGTITAFIVVVLPLLGAILVPTLVGRLTPKDRELIRGFIHIHGFKMTITSLGALVALAIFVGGYPLLCGIVMFMCATVAHMNIVE